MILADIFTYNKRRRIISILFFIVINTFLHPLTAGYIPRDRDGTLDYGSAFASNFVTWGISFCIVGLIVGGGIAALNKRKNEPLQIRTAKSVISTIFYMQFVFATIHVLYFLIELIKLYK